MPSKLEEFATTAEQAAKIGEAERSALAQTLAADFETGPEHFDPKRLMALGRAGLEIFAASVTHQTATADGAVAAAEEPQAKSVDVQGWADLRKSELSFVTQAVGLGLVGSAVIIVFALLARLFSH